MPFESEAQRRFMYAKHPKLAKEFQEATPKGADLPEHVKKEPMAEGGVWLQNETPETVKKVTHTEGAEPTEITTTGDGTKEGIAHMAEGGPIHKAEDREKEPARPTNINMSHESKLAEIYKAMGIQKYAGGGLTPEQPIGPDLGMPNQNDPNFWEQVKAALSKVAAPVTKPMGAMADMATGTAEAATPVIKNLAGPTVSALNNVTGLDLPVPPAPPVVPQGAPTPLSATTAPSLPSPAAPVVPQMPKAAPAASGTDLKNLYNQDTSKLTEGFNPEDRQKLAADMGAKQGGLGSIIAQAMAGLGDAISAKGGREQHALKDVFTMQKQQRDEALSNFDKARQARLEKIDLQTKMGDNAVKQLAAQDAYGVDENLNKQLGAPPGTAHKDLPLYMQMMTAKIAQQEKDTDLYMKAHKQAADEIESSIKNASMWNVKPSPEQIKAQGAKLADQYFNRAKGNVLFQPSDGQKALWIPAKNVEAAKKMDPQGKIIQ